MGDAFIIIFEDLIATTRRFGYFPIDFAWYFDLNLVHDELFT